MNNSINKEKKEIEKSFKRALMFPGLSYVEAITIDRELKKDLSEEYNLTFSRHGVSPSSNSGVLKTSNELSKKKNTLINITRKESSPKLRYIEAFDSAEGIEIDALNLLYANYLVNEKIAWQYFLNKYLLSRNGWPIKISNTKNDNIFESIYGLQPSQKIENGPLVSVIMPAYNNEKTIYYAVKAILDQSYTNIELIIVDDCSSDGTETICKMLQIEDKRIKYLKSKKNSGAYASRNKALMIAEGQYVTILKGDDWSFPERIAFQLKRMQELPNMKVHLGYYLRLNEFGVTTAFRICDNFSHDGVLHKCLASMFIERHFLEEKLGFWDTVRFGADAEMYSRILKIDPNLILEDPIPLYLALDRDDSLTNTPKSILGGKLIAEYSDSYMKWHDSALPSEILYSFPPSLRPFPVPSEMHVDNIEIDSNDFIVNKKVSILLLGTSRIHRIFAKNQSGNIINNIQPAIEPIFSRLGYFHTVFEVLQILKCMKGEHVIPGDLAKYVFRKENPSTTPFNEFNEEVEKAIISETSLDCKIDLNSIDHFVFEICSLKDYFHAQSGVYFHANPNFTGNFQYASLPKEGVYSEKALNIKSVLSKKATIESMKEAFTEMLQIIPVEKLTIMGHLLDPENPNIIRLSLNTMLEALSHEMGFNYVNTAPYVQEFGYRIINNVIDIHHLSDAGESKLGKDIQSSILHISKSR